MYAHILLGLVLALVAADWVSGPPPDAALTIAGAGAAAALVLDAGLAIGLYIRWGSRRPEIDEQRFLRRVGRLGRLYRLLVLALYAGVLFGLDWAALAASWACLEGWTVVRFAIAVAPLVVFQAAAWLALFSADQRLRAFLVARAGAAVAARQWTLPHYLEFMFRQYLLIMLGPLVVLVAAGDAVAQLVGPPESNPFAATLLVACLLVAVALSGLWFRLCWRTQPMPASGLRDRLQALADRAGIRIGNILVWRTNITIANGCMVGLVGPLRYILITDTLLVSLAPEEVEAVFAHEVGHVKFRHVLLYVVMAMGGVGAGLMAGEAAAVLNGSFWTENIAVAAVVLAYWGLAFGYVSRRCEQECDLYAIEAPPCPVGCSGAPGAAVSEPRQATALPVTPGMPCEHRVLAFVTALRRIARLNGAAETSRGWRHFSIARRCGFLADVLADPSLATRARRSLRRLKILIVGASVILVAAAALLTLSLGGTSESDDPENPAGPHDVAPRIHRRLIRLVDGHEVHAVALRAPQFGRDADPVADLDDRHHPRLRRGIAARDHQVAVAKPRRHAVAVDAQSERARPDRADLGQVHELDDALGRRRG